MSPRANREGEREGPFTHHFVEIDRTLSGEPTKVRFHYTECGDREKPAIVWLHGVPDSWYMWHRQMVDLSDNYYSLAFDEKGFGQSSKPYSNVIYPARRERGGDYSREMAGDEVVTALDALGIQRFFLVTHDWGSWMGAIMASRWRERILGYVKAQSTVAVHDRAQVPQARYFKLVPRLAIRFLDKRRDLLVRSLFGTAERSITHRRTVRDIDPAWLDRIIEEFSYPGCIRGWISYHNGLPSPAQYLQSQTDAFARYNFPTLLLQGARDPAQPVWYFDGTKSVQPRFAVWPRGPFPWGTRFFVVDGGKPAPEYFAPGIATLKLLEEIGHFTPHEAPVEFSNIVRTFFDGIIR